MSLIKSFLRSIYIYYQIIYIKKAIKKSRKNDKNIIFLFASPTHSNLGDQAIAYAEISFIKNHLKNTKIIELPLFNEDSFAKMINKLKNSVSRNDIFAGLGGGNMGADYLREENCRRCVINNFPENKIVIFPQTLDFGSTKEGKLELEKSQKIYSSHKNLTIIARENYSYYLMKEAFPINNILLTPDIVLSLELNNFNFDRNGVLLCLRDDPEGIISKEDKENITNLCQRINNTVKFTDTISDKKVITPTTRKVILFDKLREFARSELVITDRLHGMVFSAITSTPCIVFSNYNHKVSGTYNWIKNLNYIKFCEDKSCLAKLINEIKDIKCEKYNAENLNMYWSIISENIK